MVINHGKLQLESRENIVMMRKGTARRVDTNIIEDLEPKDLK